MGSSFFLSLSLLFITDIMYAILPSPVKKYIPQVDLFFYPNFIVF